MSWWVLLARQPELRRDGTPTVAEDTAPKAAQSLELYTVPRFTDGGTFALGGTTEAEFNVTYNYGGRFREALSCSFRDLHNQQAGVVLPRLEAAVASLRAAARADPRPPSSDYWVPTAANAARALARLRDWARLHPEGYFLIH